ncbi:hypothetical protein B0H14DRAFT_2505137 [Mycena olivaceomarginata]|nr:hypothetical protein B0H14DRAFT_2505137 [Mycena olivaceomarginata]
MPEPRQADGLWFSHDSLVVLRAEDLTFRVPMSILAARSPVFQAMFEFPRPTSNADEMVDGDEVIEGSRVIRLHDSATEVEAFLRATLDTSYFMPPPSEVNFHDLLGILRLSHKYDVGYLYQRAISHLETIYPLELRNVGKIRPTIIDYDVVGVDMELKSIAVLHEVGATWLLPFAYHNIAEYSLVMLDRELEIPSTLWDEYPAHRKETILRLYKLQTEATERLYHALTPLSNCSYRDSCNLAKFKFLKRREGSCDHRPLRQWTFNNRDDLEAALCTACLAQGQAQYNTVRTKIWSELPANCGLENWDVLSQQRNAALS